MPTTGPGAVAARPPWRRWLLAAIPWVAAAGLAVLGLTARAGLPSSATATTTPAALASPEAPTSTAAPTQPAPVTTQVTLAAGLELSVVAAARTALGTAGLPVDGPAADRWPLEVHVADVRQLGGDLAVATVHGLVIEQRDGVWQAPRPRAVAVPLRLQPPAVLGAGWPLPPPSLLVDLPPGTAVDEPGPAVVATLESMGWSLQEVTAVELIERRWLRVSLRGAAPGDEHAATHTVWLRDDPGGPAPLLPTNDPHHQETP